MVEERISETVSLMRPVWILFKVTVNYRYEMMTFLVERGVLAADRHQALNLMLESLKLDRAIEWKALVEATWDAKVFDRDALLLPCINGSGSVEEVIKARGQ